MEEGEEPENEEIQISIPSLFFLVVLVDHSMSVLDFRTKEDIVVVDFQSHEISLFGLKLWDSKEASKVLD